MKEQTPNQTLFLQCADESAETLRKDLAGVPYLHYHERNRTRTLDFLPQPGLHPLLKIEADPQGAVSITSNGEPYGLNLVPSRDQLRVITESALATAIAQHALPKMAGTGALPGDLLNQNTARHLSHLGYRVLSDLQENNSFPAWLQGRPRNSMDPKEIITLLITSDETLHLLKRYRQSYQGHSVQEYNTVHLNRDVFKALESRDHPPLHYYLNRIAPKTGEVLKFSNPAQLTKLVKHHTQLPDDLWRVFAKIPDSAWPEDQAHDPQALQRICRIVKRANPAPHKEENLGYAISRLCQMSAHLDIPWDHGDTSEPWANLLSEYLKTAPDYTATRSDLAYQTLCNISDAIRASIQHQQPWPNASWEHLRRRSDRWHREFRQFQQRLTENQTAHLAHKVWESAIEPVTLNGYTFVPITDGLTLHNLGQAMGNCLSNYVQACVTGHTRVFRVDQDETPVGAVSLDRTNGRWTRDQSEGNNRTPLPKEAAALHQRLAEIYHEADRITLIA